MYGALGYLVTQYLALIMTVGSCDKTDNVTFGYKIKYTFFCKTILQIQQVLFLNQQLFTDTEDPISQ